jgi:hypothetical protein
MEEVELFDEDDEDSFDNLCRHIYGEVDASGDDTTTGDSDSSSQSGASSSSSGPSTTAPPAKQPKRNATQHEAKAIKDSVERNLLTKESTTLAFQLSEQGANIVLGIRWCDAESCHILCRPCALATFRASKTFPDYAKSRGLEIRVEKSNSNFLRRMTDIKAICPTCSKGKKPPLMSHPTLKGVLEKILGKNSGEIVLNVSEAPPAGESQFQNRSSAIQSYHRYRYTICSLNLHI